MAQIVKSYLAKSVSFKEHREVLTHVIGVINIAYRIHVYVVNVVLFVSVNLLIINQYCPAG